MLSTFLRQSGHCFYFKLCIFLASFFFITTMSESSATLPPFCKKGSQGRWWQPEEDKISLKNRKAKMYFSIQMTLQKKKPPPIIAFLAVAANQTALFRICNWQQQKGCLACWQKAQSRLFSGICFFPFLLTKRFGWIPEMNKHVFSLLLAKDSLYVTYALLGCPFFFFQRTQNISLSCLFFSFVPLSPFSQCFRWLLDLASDKETCAQLGDVFFLFLHYSEEFDCTSMLNIFLYLSFYLDFRSFHSESV